jgi:hypothetical protein
MRRRYAHLCEPRPQPARQTRSATSRAESRVQRPPRSGGLTRRDRSSTVVSSMRARPLLFATPSGTTGGRYQPRQHSEGTPAGTAVHTRSSLGVGYVRFPGFSWSAWPALTLVSARPFNGKEEVAFGTAEEVSSRSGTAALLADGGRAPGSKRAANVRNWLRSTTRNRIAKTGKPA